VEPLELRRNERYLLDRQPVATIGVVCAQENVDFFGRDHAEQRVRLPERGIGGALLRARIPYLPRHADHIARDAAARGLKALILPNIGALSDAQCAAIRDFVAAGGGPLATGESSRYDEWGVRQPGRLVLHLINLTSARTWRTPIHELIAVGPLQITLTLPDGVAGQTGKLLVGEGAIAVTREGNTATVTIPTILDHEVLVIE